MRLWCPSFAGRGAVELGIFNEARPTSGVLARGLEIAADASAKAPQSIAKMKQLLMPGSRTLDETLGAEARALRYCMDTADWREGVAAFAERRDPHFRGE